MFGLSTINVVIICIVGTLIAGLALDDYLTKQDNKVYIANQSKLEQALNLQQAQISDLVTKTNHMIEQSKVLENKISGINTESKRITRLINTSIDPKTAKADPKKMEQKVNQGTADVFGQLTTIGASK